MGRMQGMRADTDRRAIFDNSAKYNKTFEGWLTGGRLTEIMMETLSVKEKEAVEQTERALRLKLAPDGHQPSILRGEDGRPALSVNSVRPAYRVGPTGENIADLVVEITQQRAGYLDRGVQEKVDKGKLKRPPKPDFTFRGGVTILIALESGQVRYAIGKTVKSDRRLEMQRRFYEDRHHSLGYTYFGDPNLNYFKGDGLQREPFALLHRGESLEEDF
jgi:hypothetical protein